MKRNFRRFLAMTLVLVMTMATAVMAEGPTPNVDNNPQGSDIEELEADKIMESNKGTIAVNFGHIINNEGHVIVNRGVIENNCSNAEVQINAETGRINDNQGRVCRDLSNTIDNAMNSVILVDYPRDSIEFSCPISSRGGYTWLHVGNNEALIVSPKDSNSVIDAITAEGLDSSCVSRNPDGKTWSIAIPTDLVKLFITSVSIYTPSGNCGDAPAPAPAPEQKKEESSSSSSPAPAPAPVLTPAQQAKQTEVQQGVVGTPAYQAKQAEAVQTITQSIAVIDTMTRAQRNAAVRNGGVAVNLGGCTTLSPAVASQIISNTSKVPFTLSFNWNGITFGLQLPRNAKITSLLDANGNLQIWKLVQMYGIKSAVVQK